jgi:Glycosyl transferases group 1
MRIAFITSLLPSKTPDTGFEIANVCVLAALKDAGVDVVQFGFLRNTESSPAPPDSVLLERIVIENAVAGRRQKLRWLIASILRGLPVISTKLALYDEEKLRQVIEKHGPFDAYILNSAPVAGAFPSLMRDKPSILLAHNVEHASARENAGSTSGITGFLYARESRLLQKVETTAIQHCKFIWCLAEEDRQGFGVNIDAKSSVLPLLIPNQNLPKNAEAQFDVGLIGTWTWQPNLVGLKWFVDEVASKLPSDLSIAIAGRLPEGFQANQPNIALLGRVQDAAAFVASSRVIALSSRTGTGIQLKTIETLQAGKAAVATPSSVRGVGKLPTTCLVADNSSDFANALTKLVRDVRSGRTSRSDSQGFIKQRQIAMQEAIRKGLQAITGQ